MDTLTRAKNPQCARTYRGVMMKAKHVLHYSCYALNANARFPSLLISCLLALGLATAIPAAAQTETQTAIDAYLQAYLDKTGAPGLSCVVVKDGSLAYLKGFGVEVAGTAKPMSPDSSSAIGSLTKSFTALALMQLKEKGLVELDAPVIRYLPWFRLADKETSDRITLRMLLNNRSGIPSIDDWSLDLDSTDDAIERGVRNLDTYRSNRAPGTSFEYSNENWCVLGLIISKQSGLPYREYLRLNILEPLGMTRSSTDLATIEKMGALTGHHKGLDDFIPASRKFQSMGLPAGTGLSCSARDMGAYLLMILGKGAFGKKRIISEDGFAELIKPAINMPGLSIEMGGSGANDYYAMGWMRSDLDGRQLVLHGGNILQMSSMTIMDVKTGIGVSILFNFDSNLDPYRFDTSSRLAYNVLRLAEGQGLSAFGIPTRRDPNLAEPFIAVERAVVNRLLGSYETEDDIKLNISERGNVLIVDVDSNLYKAIYTVNFASPNRLILINKTGSLPARAIDAEGGGISSISIMGKNAYVSRPNLPSGYSEQRSTGAPWSIPLPAGMRASYANSVLQATDGKRGIRIGLESGSAQEPSAFLPPSLKVIRSGGISIEQHRGMAYWVQSFSFEDGSGMTICSSARGRSSLVMRISCEASEMTKVIQEILIPILDATKF